jgi:glycosyltransferase involved in cell wall biosynthesis
MLDIISSQPAPLIRVQRTRADLDSAPPFVSFAMPAYNEEANIEHTIGECIEAFKSAGIGTSPPVAGNGSFRWGEIVVTNDCSKDTTGQILSRLQASIPCLVIVTHLERNQGYGRALSDAIGASRGVWVATIDSDGQFDPSDLKSLLSKAEDGIDCVAGYRRKKQDSFLRIMADRSLNLIVRGMFGIRHRDTNCAFKLVKGDLIRALNIETNGFQTPTEIVLKLHADSRRMVESEVRHRVREQGKSKLRVIKTSLDFLRFLFYMRTKIMLYKRGIITRL